MHAHPDWHSVCCSFKVLHDVCQAVCWGVSPCWKACRNVASSSAYTLTQCRYTGSCRRAISVVSTAAQHKAGMLQAGTHCLLLGVGKCARPETLQHRTTRHKALPGKVHDVQHDNSMPHSTLSMHN